MLKNAKGKWENDNEDIGNIGQEIPMPFNNLKRPEGKEFDMITLSKNILPEQNTGVATESPKYKKNACVSHSQKNLSME